MANLTTKIKLYVNKEIDERRDFVIQNDGNGAYIKEWNLDVPKPTLEQLDAYEEQANEYEQNLILEEQNKEQRKQSAISKLKAIGLTDEEINSLLGK